MNMKKRLRKFFTMKHRANEGFTLVELIIVIAIVAILGGVAVPAYSGYIAKADAAADAQLLGDINKAFAAACMVEGLDNYKLTSATAEISEEGKLTGVTANDDVAFNDTFIKFFDNTGAFKKTAELRYDSGIGGFYDPAKSEKSAAFKAALQYVLDNFAEEIGLIEGTAYDEMGAEKLMGTVEGVTGLAAEMLKNDESTLSLMMDQAYFNNLAKILDKESGEALYYEYMTMLQEDPDAARKYLANSTVLSVASTVNSDSYDRAALANRLASGELKDIAGAVTSSENGLAEAALIYGLYTAYAPDKAGSVTGLSGLSQLNTSDPGFGEYLKGLSDPNSPASKDMNAYYAALDIVNGAVSNDPTVADQVMSNGYTDKDLVDMVGSVIGG